ncbi:hypothetical protein FRC03_006295 [Tulasnella sp. 419]|nr:hypothetical protein FRC03_006295 [Tulasnella sp. 419]
MDTICQNPKVSVKQYEEFGAIIENATEPQDVKGAYHITEQTDWPRQAQLAGPENVLAFMAYLKCADGIDEEEMQQIEALKQYANKR